MTISSLSASVICLGNGVSTSFGFSFIYDTADNIQVTYTDTNGIATVLLPSQYTLSLNAPGVGQLWGNGGSVVYPTSGSPIANGTSITISRIVPLTQTTSISNQGDFYPTVVEQALDTLCLEIQQVAGRTGQIRGVWATGISYNYADVVQDGINGANTQNYYMCASANTSGVWATDLAAGDWILAINVQAIIAGGTGNMSTLVYDPAHVNQQLVGISATQTITNKTLGDSNIITVKDNSFTVEDDIDITKKFNFSASNIATGTTRTLTIQNVSGVLYVAGGQDVTIADGGTGASTQQGAANNVLPAQTGNALKSLVTDGTNVTFSGNTVLQRVSFFTGTLATGTTAIPADNSIPQQTEGDQYMSLSITPISATSILIIEIIAALSCSTSVIFGMSLFQDSTANALRTALLVPQANNGTMLSLKHIITSGTTSSTTFKVRAAGAAGTTTFNGQVGTAYYGGNIGSSIIITEYAF